MGWLNVDELEAVQPDKLLFPEFTEGLRADFSAEIEQFLASVLLGDRNVQDAADRGLHVRERAARAALRRAVGCAARNSGGSSSTDPTRHGLLGKGAVLLRTSYGDRTSPVLRGAWVLDKLLGTPPTPPPPGVETNLSAEEGEEPKTLRERLEQHRNERDLQRLPRRDRSVRLGARELHGHGPMARRRREAEAPIDASTELPGGKPITGPVELAAALLERADQFVQALTAEAHDVRGRTRARVLRHAASSRRRARGRRKIPDFMFSSRS